MKKLLILGGTSGFGLTFARASVPYYFVTVTGRRALSEPAISNVILDSANLDVEWLRAHDPDIVVNNAYDKKDHRLSFSNSLIAVRESLKFFKEKKGGGIVVNVNSIAGLQPDTKDPDYAASKHGLRGYVDSVSHDAYLSGINIINLYPRAVATGFSEGRGDFSKLIDPKELANFCLLLLRTRSFYISTIVFDRVFSFSAE